MHGDFEAQSLAFFLLRRETTMTDTKYTKQGNAIDAAQKRGFKEGYSRAREGWALWHSRLPMPLQVALTAQAVSPDSITYTQHKNGSLTIKVIAAPSE
jgi:hypothetical protein